MISNYIKQLIGIKYVIVTKIRKNNTYTEIYISTKPSYQTCPCCGSLTKRIHDYRTQRIKDLPSQLDDCFLVLRKRRYVCSCGKRFYEHYSFIGKYMQHTTRLAYKVIDELRYSVSMAYVADKCNVSANTVSRLFDTVKYERPHIPRTLSIDEFKGNATTGKYQCILVNPVKKQVLDILPDRTQSISSLTLNQYLEMIAIK